MNKNYLLLIISVLIFSSMGLFVRMISVSGLVIYFFAALISTLIFGFLLFREGKLKIFFTKRSLLIPILIGLFAAINNSTYFYAFQLTTIANATFAHFLFPIFILIFSPLILGEATHKKMWFSFIIAMTGLLILININNLDFSSLFALGIFLAFISAIANAFGIIFLKKASRNYSNKETLFAHMLFSVIILLPFVIYLKPQIIVSDIFPLITLGVIHQGFNVLLFISALRNIKTQTVSIIAYLEPVGAVILALIFLSEIPTLYTLIGGALILVSCYMIMKSSGNKKE